jgi:hypothetical protein
MASEDDEKNLIKWLNALIAMAQWDPNLPFYFARLFNQPQEYKETLRLIRKLPITVPPSSWPGPTLSEKEWQTVYEKTTTVASLRKLFDDHRNPFEGALSSQIFLLAEVSDLTTSSDPQKVFYSQNGAFHLVLAAVRQAAARQDAEVNMKSLIGDCFHKFYILFDTDPDITEELYKLASSNDWYPVLASLKDAANYTTAGSETSKTLDEWNNRLTQDLRTLVLTMFHVPRTLVKLAWERRKLFEEALGRVAPGSIPPALLPPPQRTELREQVSNEAHKIFVEKAQAEVDAIERDLKWLAVIAKHYISARKFVKLDGLVYSWPRIASLAMANYSSLRYVEDLLLTAKPEPSINELEANDARELYELCANNRAVIRFLKLHPRFTEIDPNELRRYRPLAPGEANTSGPSPSASMQNVPNTSQMPGTPGGSAVTRVCELVIRSINPPGNRLPGQDEDVELWLRVPDKEVAKGRVTFSIRKLLDRILAAIGVTSEDALHNTLKGLFSLANATEVLLRGGKELFSAIIIESGLEKQFTDAVEEDGPVRLVIIVPSMLEELHCLPWEWFPRPGYKELLLANPRFSIVRSKPVRSEVFAEPLSPPVRVMGVFPNAPLGARDVSDSSIKELEKLKRAGAHYQPLKRDDASVIRVREEFGKFRPQIVHFEGYVSASAEENAAVRILFSKEKTAEPVGRQEFESLLKENKVQLLVLGRNETNRVYGNAVLILASRVVRMAVPTVLAPIRAIDEVTATAFTTEFYTALLAGNTLEQALFIARQKVAARGGDWTPFALFSDPWVLDDFKPLPPAS